MAFQLQCCSCVGPHNLWTIQPMKAKAFLMPTTFVDLWCCHYPSVLGKSISLTLSSNWESTQLHVCQTEQGLRLCHKGHSCRPKSLELTNSEVGKRWSRHDGILILFNISSPKLPPGKVLDHLIDCWELEVSWVIMLWFLYYQAVRAREHQSNP